jgi:tungstate transport system substrate-binding protein
MTGHVPDEGLITMEPRTRERHLLRHAGADFSIIVATLLAVSGFSGPASGEETEAVDRGTVRLLTVGAALTDGMLADVLADFEAESGYEVTVTMGGPDIFDRARASEADLVMAHFGFTELEDFVSDGLGHWPATVMSNTVAFLAPPGDPVGIRNAADPVEAFRLIAEGQHPFIVNNLGETLYITDTAWNAVGQPDKGDWFRDPGLSGPGAVREAARQGAYTIWGLHPFLMLQDTPQRVNLEAVVYNDSLTQRILATVVVRRPPGRANQEGALALQEYLVRPDTQAAIRNFRTRDIDMPIFWPAGNQNDN